MRQGLRGSDDLIAMLTQIFRNLGEDPLDFAKFIFSQPHQLVVELDRLQRFDKERAPRSAGAVNYAVNAALLARDDRHHEPVVADGDEVFLDRSVRAMRPQEPLQRLLDGLLLSLHLAANPSQR